MAFESFGESDSTAVDSSNPWPGLAAFREQDRGFFVGREEQAEALYRMVLRGRLTVLFSLSGLGKTSLLQAGLFPMLRQDNYLPVYVRVDHSPSAAPARDQILQAVVAECARCEIEAPSPESVASLWEYFHRQGACFWNKRNRVVTPVLILDQFEEVFTLGGGDDAHRARTQAYLTENADLIEGRPPLALRAELEAQPEKARLYQYNEHNYKIVLALREDFLPDLEELRPLIPSLGLNRFRLTRMSGTDALRVAKCGRDIVDNDVAEALVRFVAGDTTNDRRGDIGLEGLRVEPALLSLFCRELNNKRLALGLDKITADIVAGSRSEILRDFYERSVRGLGDGVRQFIEDKLLTVSGFRDSVALENALREPAVTSDAISRLVDGRLLRIDERGGMQRVELTHDVLTGVIRESRDRRREAQQARAWRRRFALVAGVLLVVVAGGGYAFHREWQRAEDDFIAALSGRGRDALLANEPRKSLPYLTLSYLKDPSANRRFLVARALERAIPLFMIKENNGPIRAVRFTPEGKHLLTVSETGTITSHTLAWQSMPVSKCKQPWVDTADKTVLRLQSGMPITLEGAKGAAVAALTPDGRLAVTLDPKAGARLWDARSGKQIAELQGHDGPITSAAFSPDGARVVTGGRDKTARLWNARTGRALRVLEQHRGAVNGVRFSADGRHIATASDDQSARIWDAQTGELLLEVDGHTARVRVAEESPDGHLLATVTSDGMVEVWTASTGERLTTLQRRGAPVTDVAFSPDGKLLVTANDDGSVRLWSTRDWIMVMSHEGHRARLTALEFSPDSKLLLTASLDGTAQIWDAKLGSLTQNLHHNGTRYSTAVFTGVDGRSLIALDEEGGLTRWRNWSRPEEVTTLANIKTSRVFGADVEGNIAFGTEDGEVMLWPTRATSARSLARCPGGRCRAIAFDREGKRLAVAGGGDSREDSVPPVTEILDGETGKLLASLAGHTQAVNSAAFSPDGTRVVTASQDGTARVEYIGGETPAVELRGHSAPVVTAEFSPDGERIVTASEDRTAAIWSATGGDPTTLEGHFRAVRSARFSADPIGTFVVTASDDGTFRIWLHRSAIGNSIIGIPLTVVRADNHDVRSAVFSPEAEPRYVVSTGDDGDIRVWDLPLARICGEDLQKLVDCYAGYRLVPPGNRFVSPEPVKPDLCQTTASAPVAQSLHSERPPT